MPNCYISRSDLWFTVPQQKPSLQSQKMTLPSTQMLKPNTSLRFLRTAFSPITPDNPINPSRPTESTSKLSFIVFSSFSTATNLVLVNYKTHLIGLLVPYLSILFPLPTISSPPILYILANLSFPQEPHCNVMFPTPVIFS